jgi:S-formylglutathione hydrolase FrmB
MVFLVSLSALASPVVERVQLPSRFVPPGVEIWTLLPPSYQSGKSYPVVYFLHDGMGDEATLERRGIADHTWLLMKEGRLPEFIIVAPRGIGSWFIDSFDGRVRFGSFLAQELVPFVDRTWRTIPEKSGRSVFGISMGGYGAVRWGLARPELFASIGGLSPALQPMNYRSFARFPFFIRPSMLRVFGKSAAEENTRENDLYQILLSQPDLAAQLPPVFVRCGAEDGYALDEVAGFFRDFLNVMRVPNEVVIEPGTHDWPYWRVALPQLLSSLTRTLNTASLPHERVSTRQSRE